MAEAPAQGSDVVGSGTKEPSTDSLKVVVADERGGTRAFDTLPEGARKATERAALEANVILIAHPENRRLGSRFRLRPGDALEIGRSSSAAISLPEVLSVSRSHARLSFQGHQVTVEDLGSTNGTLVNEQPVRGARRLKSGDRFQVGAVHFKFLHEQDVEHAFHEAIYELVMHDGLTGAFNKRKFGEELEREHSRARRHRRPLSLVLFDIDNFKSVNDLHGHLCGDALLKQLAATVVELLRAEQLFARVGGEEFVILCPETPFDGAAVLAEKLRARFESQSYVCGEATLAVTCSFGVAEVERSMTNPEDLYAAADTALYEAKRAGRNRVAGKPARRADSSRGG